jgi:hypothetical protein
VNKANRPARKYNLHSITRMSTVLYYIPPIIPVLYTRPVCSCTSVTRLIDRVSNAQIKYRLMNRHFSDGKCSRRREAALYILYGQQQQCAGEIIIITCRRQRRRWRRRRNGYNILKTYIEMIYSAVVSWIVRRSKFREKPS